MQKQRYHLIAAISALILFYPLQNKCYSAQEKSADNYLVFEQSLEQSQTAKAMEFGEDLFASLMAQSPEDKGLNDLKKKIEVAERIAGSIITDLKSRQKKALVDIGGFDMFSKSSKATAPAATPERLYWSNIQYFQSEPAFEQLSGREVTFLYKYYDLKMNALTEQIFDSVDQLAVTQPESLDPYHYSLILPLLHKGEDDRAWESEDFVAAIIQRVSIYSVADFCLLKLERPQTAVAMAKTVTKESFPDWAVTTSQWCAENLRPDIAEMLLQKAIEEINDQDRKVELLLKIAENYGSCGDSDKAAKKCKQIATEFPKTKLYGKVMSSYFAYLAKETKAEDILLEIDSVLEKPESENYRVQLLYLKWWALRKVARPESAKKVGQQLITDYRANACIAPVLLAHATDALSNQDYKGCEDLLVQLTENFPQTNSAKQAQKILDSLNKQNAQ